MVFSASLAARVRQAIGPDRAIQEKRMFGGLVFLQHGNLLVAVWGTGLIARVGVERAKQDLRQPFVRPFDDTGKPMKGWVVVEAEGLDLDADITRWIARAREFVDTLPPK